MNRCEFPKLSALTAYKRGCRCPRCFASKQVQTRQYVRRSDEQAFVGCASQAVIDEWAARVWATWTDKEQRTIREILT